MAEVLALTVSGLGFDMCVGCAESQVDRVYLDAATRGKGPVYVAPGHNEFLLEYVNRQGFRDMGVWSPLAELPDPTLHRNFVAYSSGAIARPVKWVKPLPLSFSPSQC